MWQWVPKLSSVVSILRWASISPNWDPIQQEIGDPIQKWSNVSASYQTFPIAHPHPDLQACSETCHQPTGVCEYDVQRTSQLSTVGNSMKGRSDETCQRPTWVCKQKLRPKEMQAVQSRDACYEDTQWRNPKGRQLGQNSHNICRLFNASFNSDLHNSKCVHCTNTKFCTVKWTECDTVCDCLESAVLHRLCSLCSATGSVQFMQNCSWYQSVACGTWQARASCQIPLSKIDFSSSR